jgi:hypothetical protein
MSAVIRLEWATAFDGYRIERAPPMDDGLRDTLVANAADHDPFRVVAKNKRFERYPVEGTSNEVFMDFANTPLTPEGVLAFAERWGLPASPTGPAWLDGDFYSPIRSLRDVIALANNGDPLELERCMKKTNVGVCSVLFSRLPGDSSPRVFMQPKNLLAFMHLEFMQTLAGSAYFRPCAYCGSFFTIGAGTGKRKTRRYCSEYCRVRQHRHRKGVRAVEE